MPLSRVAQYAASQQVGNDCLYLDGGKDRKPAGYRSHPAGPSKISGSRNAFSSFSFFQARGVGAIARRVLHLFPVGPTEGWFESILPDELYTPSRR